VFYQLGFFIRMVDYCFGCAVDGAGSADFGAAASAAGAGGAASWVPVGAVISFGCSFAGDTGSEGL
jgi:hypothetical protein